MGTKVLAAAGLKQMGERTLGFQNSGSSVAAPHDRSTRQRKPLLPFTAVAYAFSLDTMLSSFEAWLAGASRDELTALSIRERSSFLSPLHNVRKQVFRTLQQFRDRLSDRTMGAFGVPLRTTETEIDVVEPGTPDIRVGRVFDRNWELLSPILPVWQIGRAPV